MCHLDVAHKVVHQFEDTGLGEHFILDKHLSMFPISAKEQDVFYLQPLTKIPSEDDAPLFTSIPVGRNTGAYVVKEMCSQTKIQRKKTNHSFRASGIVWIMVYHFIVLHVLKFLPCDNIRNGIQV